MHKRLRAGAIAAVCTISLSGCNYSMDTWGPDWLSPVDEAEIGDGMHQLSVAVEEGGYRQAERRLHRKADRECAQGYAVTNKTEIPWGAPETLEWEIMCSPSMKMPD